MKGDPNQIKKKWLGNPDQIKKKWLPIIDNHFNLKNKRIEELICFYCEWLAMKTVEAYHQRTSVEKVKIEVDEELKNRLCFFFLF